MVTNTLSHSWTIFHMLYFCFPTNSAGVSSVMSQCCNPKPGKGFVLQKHNKNQHKRTDFPFLQISHPSFWQACWQERSEMSQMSSSRLCLIDHFAPPRGSAVSEGVPVLTESNQSQIHSYDAISSSSFTHCISLLCTHTHSSGHTI